MVHNCYKSQQAHLTKQDLFSIRFISRLNHWYWEWNNQVLQMFALKLNK